MRYERITEGSGIQTRSRQDVGTLRVASERRSRSRQDVGTLRVASERRSRSRQDVGALRVYVADYVGRETATTAAPLPVSSTSRVSRSRYVRATAA